MKLCTNLYLAALFTIVVATQSGCGAGSNSSASVPSPAPTLTPTTPTTPSAAPTPISAPTPTPVTLPVTTSAQNGKLIYIANCAMCHGSLPAQNSGRVLNGANAPALITSAINQNVGGMGFLRNTITAQNANDLAAYLATPSM